MSTLLHVCIAAIGGVLCHVLYFIHGEVFYESPRIFRVYAALFFILIVTECRTSSYGLCYGFLAATYIASAYALSLFSSIIIYRVLFHRLKSFPGPGLARISKFHLAWKTSMSFDQCLYLEKLRKEYGDFVRTGPNEVTIFTPNAINGVYGVKTLCTKASWWEMMWPEVSMITTRSKEGHSLGRKAWEKGFSLKALRNHEPKIRGLVDRFIDLISKNIGKAINVTKIFECYTMDTMGEVVYSINFGCISMGSIPASLHTFKATPKIIGRFTPVPWLFLVFASIPGMGREWLQFKKSCSDRLDARFREKEQKSDILEYILKSDDKDKNPHSILADFIAILAAGSDPVLCVLVFVLYHLALEPSHISILRSELQSIKNITNDEELRGLRHLNGIINETLRLHPSVPSGGLRVTPCEGLVLGDMYIPGNTTIVIPQYSLGRRDDCYEDPHKFIPERWYSKPQMILNKDAFIPFNTGNHKCLGQHLAKIEVRLVIARIIMEFDFYFAPGEKGKAVEEKILDAFVATPGPLKMVFTKRL